MNIPRGALALLLLLLGACYPNSTRSADFLPPPPPGSESELLELDSISQISRDFDGNGNVIHPGIVYLSNAVSGFHWWGAMTPYPDAPRERIFVMCSTNGIHWQTPPGVSNPISMFTNWTPGFHKSVMGWVNSRVGWELFPKAAAMCVGVTADTEMVQLPDGRLAVHFYGGADIQGSSNTVDFVFRCVSKDGLSWARDPELVLWSTNQPVLNYKFKDSLTGPRIIYDHTGTLRLFHQYYKDYRERGSNYYHAFRIATDTTGTNWTGPIPMRGIARGTWHFDVWRSGTGPASQELSLLVVDRNPPHSAYENNYLMYRSHDCGSNWVLLSRAPVRPFRYTGPNAWEGSPMHGTVWYAPSVVPLGNGRVYLFASLISQDTTSSASALDESTTKARILLARDYLLPDPVWDRNYIVPGPYTGRPTLTVESTTQYQPTLLAQQSGTGHEASVGIGGAGLPGFGALRLFDSPLKFDYLTANLWGSSNQLTLSVPMPHSFAEWRFGGIDSTQVRGPFIIPHSVNGVIQGPTLIVGTSSNPTLLPVLSNSVIAFNSLIASNKVEAPVVSSKSFVGNGAALTNIPATAVAEFVRSASWGISSSMERLSPSAPGPAPQYLEDGVGGSGAITNFSISVTVPDTATNITCTFWVCHTNLPTTTTNTFNLYWHTSNGRMSQGAPFTTAIRNVTLFTNSLQPVSFTLSGPLTNCPHTLRLTLGPSANPGNRWIAGPIKLFYQ